MALRIKRNGSVAGITYAHPWAFVLGIVMVTVGVILHLPMYIGGRDMGYVLKGMSMDGPMVAGMALILAGLAFTFYGIYPKGKHGGSTARLRIRALDDAPLKPAHVGLLLVMAAAVTIDVMKPTTLAFVVPGMAAEYGLKSPINPTGDIPVAVLPLVGIVGTVIG
ncbi:MAG: hypothetical protein ACRDJ2_08005, partial [Actinomycetota bacterium]